MVKIHKIIISFILFLSFHLFAQPRLEIKPDEIEFENIFNRLENVYFINEGDAALRIDSVVYNRNIYYIRFDQPYTNVFYLEPDDSVKMDCILAGYTYIPSSDTSDTMYVYSNSERGVEDIKVKIDYYDDDLEEGTINGLVTDGISPIVGAVIYFFYEGNYIIHSTNTDQSGSYEAELPPGSYKIAAEKDSFYVTFFGQQFDPINAEFVILGGNSIKTADIVLTPHANTFNSISGIIYDSLSGGPLKKGIVVIKGGIHTPTKIMNGSGSLTNGNYTAFIKDSGAYAIRNIIEPDNFYIQSFSDYFVPSYYSSSGTSQIFWQNADSVQIDTSLTNLNISMLRDSSLGGGNAVGTVSINTIGDTISDVIIYAQPVNNDSLAFNYAFTSHDGNFNVPFLPYGEYRLIAQKIGYYDGYSINFIVDSVNTVIKNLNITLYPNSAVDDPFIPGNHILLYNYPNPFNPSTTIEFNLPFSSDVQLKVYNILGEEIKILLNDHMSSGLHKYDFNAGDLNSGVYFVTLTTRETLNVRKILLLK